MTDHDERAFILHWDMSLKVFCDGLRYLDAKFKGPGYASEEYQNMRSALYNWYETVGR